MNTKEEAKNVSARTPYHNYTSPTGCHYMFNAAGRIVASFHGSLDGVDNAACESRDKAERESIVTACNEYAFDKAKIAALVARMEQVLPYLQKMEADGVSTAKPVSAMIRQVDEVLQLAKDNP